MAVVPGCPAADKELDSGPDIIASETGFNRSLPHAFYDQAMASLPKLYPQHVLLVKRRSGRIGEVNYALIGYRETPTSGRAVIQAVAVHEKRAWRLEAITPLPYGNTLLRVLERIGRLPDDSEN